MSYDDYAKRHEEKSREFVAATFEAISEYERVIADPNAKATDVALARDGLARAMRAMGSDPYPLDGTLDVNRDAGAIEKISFLASTLAPPPGYALANGGSVQKPGEVASGILKTVADAVAEQDTPTLSEQALENMIVDLAEFTAKRGMKIAVKPTHIWPTNYPYDGREI